LQISTYFLTDLQKNALLFPKTDAKYVADDKILVVPVILHFLFAAATADEPIPN